MKLETFLLYKVGVNCWGPGRRHSGIGLHSPQLRDLRALRSELLLLSFYRLVLSLNRLVLLLERVPNERARCCASGGADGEATASVAGLVADDRSKACADRCPCGCSYCCRLFRASASSSSKAHARESNCREGNSSG